MWHSDPDPHSLDDVQVLPQVSGGLQVTPQSADVEQIGSIPPQPSHDSGKQRFDAPVDALQVVPAAQSALDVHGLTHRVGFAQVIVHEA